MANSDDWEHVYVQFSGLIDPQTLQGNCHSLTFLGLDTEEPILKIGNAFYAGQFECVPGTSLFFEVKENCSKERKGTLDNESLANKEDVNKKCLNYIAKCDKTLIMKRIFLQPKQSATEMSAEEGDNRL